MAATPTPPPAAPICEPSSNNIYCIYTVQSGDTLSTIATKFGLAGNEDVEPWSLLVQSNKPDIVSEDDLLQVGQKLRIPAQNAVVHTVLSNQTLSDISDRYGVTPQAILGVPGNAIGDPNALVIGQELLIPNPKQFMALAPPPPTATPEPTAAPAAAAPSAAAAAPRSSGGSSQSSGGSSGSGFMWPTSGPISSYYGPSHPLGIDIDLFSAPNAPIGAAAAGVVTFAGGNPCCSYGYYVVVDHGNGYTTLYAHFSKISVSVGETVSKGETLGLGGRTGYATGNHLHFEVHRNGSVINPMTVLP
jgi:murein DD-endopeptidase MepM/ murein hydrolase activator NlpD